MSFKTTKISPTFFQLSKYLEGRVIYRNCSSVTLATCLPSRRGLLYRMASVKALYDDSHSHYPLISQGWQNSNEYTKNYIFVSKFIK